MKQNNRKYLLIARSEEEQQEQQYVFSFFTLEGLMNEHRRFKQQYK